MLVTEGLCESPAECRTKLGVTRVAPDPEKATCAATMSRSLGEPASAAQFPGIRQVAILPKRFDSADTAREFIEANAETGGNAIAVQYDRERWLVGARVID